MAMGKAGGIGHWGEGEKTCCQMGDGAKKTNKNTDHHVSLGHGLHTKSKQLAIGAGGRSPKTRVQGHFRLILK